MARGSTSTARSACSLQLSERTRHLVEGLERADSAIADGHKWLNVPYESGFAFIKDRSLQPGVFGSGAAYLPDLDDPKPQWAYLGPEMSRRARSFAVWATLRAYGRSGYRAIVERHLARRSDWPSASTPRPTWSDSPTSALNIVCFRFHPEGVTEERLDDLNDELGAAVLADGRVAFGTTTFDGMTAFRPALSNWRTRDQDVDLIVDVTRELGATLAAAGDRVTTAFSHVRRAPYTRRDNCIWGCTGFDSVGSDWEKRAVIPDVTLNAGPNTSAEDNYALAA